ncbi:MAG: hypothetical protein ABI183_17730, partial [Polyangiaceae bacterium]
LLAPPKPTLATTWRVKRNYGMTGRGQRVIDPSNVTDDDSKFLRAALGEGGLQIEPNVSLVAEFAIHGFLRQSGALVLGPVVKQHCDARGAWLSSEKIATGEIPNLVPDLLPEAERVAAALNVAGYFGPFGVDAYTYRRGADIAFQPRSEINARYTMGFAAMIERD